MFERVFYVWLLTIIFSVSFAEPDFGEAKKNYEIKSETDKYLLGNPGIVREDQQGNIYILDFDTDFIFKFDKDQKFIKKFGGRGQGPGEFNYITVFDINPQNNLIVYDVGNNRITMLTAEGNLITTKKIESGVHKIECNSDDSYFVEIRSWNKEKTSSKLYLYTNEFSKRKLIDSKYYVTETFVSKPVNNFFPLPFCGMFKWASDNKGNILSGFSTSSKFHLKNLDNKILDEINFDLKKVRVREKDKDSFFKSIWMSSSGNNEIPKEIKEKIIFPDYKDLVKQIKIYDNKIILNIESKHQNTEEIIVYEKNGVKNFFRVKYKTVKPFISLNRSGFYLIDENEEGIPKILKYSYNE